MAASDVCGVSYWISTGISFLILLSIDFLTENTVDRQHIEKNIIRLIIPAENTAVLILLLISLVVNALSFL